MDGQAVSLRKFRFNIKSCVSIFALALAMVFALVLLTTQPMKAQTFSVLHNFTGGADGGNTFSGLYVGPSGVLYGTATHGGTYDAGTVFKLSQVNSSWVFSPLYEFTGGSDGAFPEGGVVIGPNGALYGTAAMGGGEGYGTVFELRPPATFCRSVTCYWGQTVLHAFTGAPDGKYPIYVNLAFDQAGNIYGTTLDGGTYDYGTTFELTPSGAGYTESILHSFGSGTDGRSPFFGVVLDTAGNVYGTTPTGGTGPLCALNCGTVYQLTPSNGGWLENVLVNFKGGDGRYPNGLIMDTAGNLYGTTLGNGQGGDLVYKLASSDGGFTYSVLYRFISYCESNGGVAMDAAGHFFGVCIAGGIHNDGWIYELSNCSETCTLIDLHDFSGSDGSSPYPGPVLDANGDLYGTTYLGGTGNCEGTGCGVVWEIAGVGAPQRK